MPHHLKMADRCDAVFEILQRGATSPAEISKKLGITRAWAGQVLMTLGYQGKVMHEGRGIYRAVEAKSEAKLAADVDASLSVSAIKFIDTIYHSEQGALSRQQLREAIKVNRKTVYKIGDRLIKKGYIEQKNQLYELTEAGKQEALKRNLQQSEQPEGMLREGTAGEAGSGSDRKGNLGSVKWSSMSTEEKRDYILNAVLEGETSPTKIARSIHETEAIVNQILSKLRRDRKVLRVERGTYHPNKEIGDATSKPEVSVQVPKRTLSNKAARFLDTVYHSKNGALPLSQIYDTLTPCSTSSVSAVGTTLVKKSYLVRNNGFYEITELGKEEALRQTLSGELQEVLEGSMGRAVTTRHAGVLAELRRGVAGPTKIAEKLGVDETTVAYILRRLKKDGLVLRAGWGRYKIKGEIGIRYTINREADIINAKIVMGSERYGAETVWFPLVGGSHLPDFIVRTAGSDYKFPRMYLEFSPYHVIVKYLFAQENHDKDAGLVHNLYFGTGNSPPQFLKIVPEWNANNSVPGCNIAVNAVGLVCINSAHNVDSAIKTLNAIGTLFRFAEPDGVAEIPFSFTDKERPYGTAREDAKQHAREHLQTAPAKEAQRVLPEASINAFFSAQERRTTSNA